MLDLDPNEFVFDCLVSIIDDLFSNDFSDLKMFWYKTYLESILVLELFLWFEDLSMLLLLKSISFIYSLLVSNSFVSKFN